jgi:ppGpp synthetase/RelA/SpoT-type nucleotidyltranferase
MARAKISPGKHRRQIEKYRAVESIYKKYAKVMDQILTNAVAVYAPSAIVQTRPKSLSSFAEKIIRKADKYNNPLEGLTDLCGARVITHTQAQVYSISQFIKEHFDIHEMDSIDVGTRLKIMEFGYISLHYIVSISKDTIMGVPIPEQIKGKKAEIQLRTLLQHTWADIVHDRIYKSPIRVPDAVVRESARLAALMENSDRGFAGMAAVIDAYAAGFGASLHPDEWEREVNMLGAILKNEPKDSKKPHIALKLAQIYRSSGEWNKIIKLLGPLKISDGELKQRINLELGHAYCRRYRHKPSDKRFLQGQRLLRNIAHPEIEIVPQAKTSLESSYDMQLRTIRARATYYLACSARLAGKPDDVIRRLHHSAYLLDTSNPYIFTAFLECEINYHRGTDFLKLLAPSIISAIETCRDHIKVDIEIPLPYLTIGKLWLMLDNIYESLNAYTKAIDLYSSRETSASTELIDDELASLERLSTGGTLAGNSQLVKKLFGLAQAVIGGQSRDEMKLPSHIKFRYKSPVQVIAGGTTGLLPAALSGYKKLLLNALSGYSGSLISGGTKSGICGVIGSVVGRLRKEKSIQCDLVGYLPGLIPANVTRDDRNYELVTTDGMDYSPLEPLQYWIDIIGSGICPAHVRVLGINGGDLSGFEFRLALALGATVGIVDSSGRAASALLQDQDWMDHPRLLVLSRDPKTLWAFMTQDVSSRLRANQIDKAARQVHMDYCDVTGPSATDPSLLSWDLLPESLKESNRQQVLYMEEILRHAGYCIRPAGKRKKKLAAFSPKEIELMAEMEHGRWNVERLRCGWCYGSKKNVEKKISPYLKAWKELPNHIKDYDRQAVENFPSVLGEAGFEVYRCKKALS